MKKRIKKISRLMLLIGVGQIWGLLCNLYLLSYQPFLTLRTIVNKRDKSQFALLSGMAMVPVLLYVVTRIGWDYFKYGRMLNGVGGVFAVTVLVEGLILSYLLYWSVRVIWKNQNDLFVEKR